MEKVTTIPEICSKYNLQANTVRWLIESNKVSRQTLTKKQLNGFTGHLYLISDLEPLIKDYFERKRLAEQKEQEAIKLLQEEPKKYKLDFVCKVLRSNLKSTLCNKVLNLWTREDWIDFNKMISP